MAENPKSVLTFEGRCPDCAKRQVELPPSLPEPGDDFDWLARDYDSFRRLMLEELAGRFPERTRWTAGDLEVVLVEALAAVLDQLSDMADRMAAEAYLETARRPESVRRLLSFIGYDALALAPVDASIPKAFPSAGEDLAAMRVRLKKFLPGLNSFKEAHLNELTPSQQQDLQDFLDTLAKGADEDLDTLQHFLITSPALVEWARRWALHRFWILNSSAMEEARAAGPRAIHTQRRMVTVADYADRLTDHPLVLRASSWSAWTGSWPTVRVATVLWNDHPLDEEGLAFPEDLRERVMAFHQFMAFHQSHRIWEPVWEPDPPTIRTILRPYLEAWRMAGQEVVLEDAVPVGIKMFISIRVRENYFQSEVRNAVRQALGTGPGGFFEPGRHDFGEDLYASDVFQTLMSLDGVENVCLNRFKRFGDQYLDQTDTGRIPLQGLEIAVCDNDPRRPERGYISLTLTGGRRG